MLAVMRGRRERRPRRGERAISGDGLVGKERGT
jgi:hypothetical protein